MNKLRIFSYLGIFGWDSKNIKKKNADQKFVADSIFFLIYHFCDHHAHELYLRNVQRVSLWQDTQMANIESNPRNRPQPRLIWWFCSNDWIRWPIDMATHRTIVPQCHRMLSASSLESRHDTFTSGNIGCLLANATNVVSNDCVYVRIRSGALAVGWVQAAFIVILWSVRRRKKNVYQNLLRVIIGILVASIIGQEKQLYLPSPTTECVFRAVTVVRVPVFLGSVCSGIVWTRGLQWKVIISFKQK
jgi:hypothetical protein